MMDGFVLKTPGFCYNRISDFICYMWVTFEDQTTGSDYDGWSDDTDDTLSWDSDIWATNQDYYYDQGKDHSLYIFVYICMGPYSFII